MKIETIEKYLVSLKDGTPVEGAADPVCGIKFCYGSQDYVKVGHSDDFESEFKVELSKADETLTYVSSDGVRVVIPVDRIFSITVYEEKHKIQHEDIVTIR